MSFGGSVSPAILGRFEPPQADLFPQQYLAGSSLLRRICFPSKTWQVRASSGGSVSPEKLGRFEPLAPPAKPFLLLLLHGRRACVLPQVIQDIADNHSFVFLWVGSAEGLEEGRRCFKKWDFLRRVDDICLLKTNHENRDASGSVNNHRGALFKRTKEHFLMGIKNNIPPHRMHPNIDVDIIVSEEPPYGSTQKPEYLYRVIEHLIQGRKRIAFFFGEDHNLLLGWLTVGNGAFLFQFQ